jgi:elongation factor P--(R)-beta-lysine ligase
MESSLLRRALAAKELIPMSDLTSHSSYSEINKRLQRGRCLAKEGNNLLIRRLEPGAFTPYNASISVRNPDDVKVGDIVEIESESGKAKTLTPNRTAKADGQTTSLWIERILDPRRLRAIRVRNQVEASIREFFLSRDFMETRTPLLVPSPGMETHIRPFPVERPQHFGSGKTYLPTSPEFAMKRLLVGGLERIFQICSAFREEPRSVTHHPEFTILEWYRAYAGYEDIMRDTEELFEFVALKLFGKPSLQFDRKEISVKTPWPRLKVRDLFLEKVGIDLVKCSSLDALTKECRRLGLSVSAQENSEENWDDLYFKIWLNHIEHSLPANQAVFVTRYPKSQAALSVVDQDPDGTEWARRFEIYAGGLELGNAFEELTDPSEQRRRFEKDMRLRTEVYGPSFPTNAMDEEFLGALTEGMPPAGGIAVGVDRMVMLFANEPEIDQTLWLRSGEYTLAE